MSKRTIDLKLGSVIIDLDKPIKVNNTYLVSHIDGRRFIQYAKDEGTANLANLTKICNVIISSTFDTANIDPNLNLAIENNDK